MLNLYERQIVCVCESCWALRSGETEFRPVGSRTLWLEDFELPEEIWAQFRIPIGLAFFMYSSVTDCVVAMYPSPAGATESELHFETWNRLAEMNPVLHRLEPDAEALIVNRIADPPAYAIAPIDRCYMLVGLVKSAWEGISGGAGVERAIEAYFDELRAAAAVSEAQAVEIPVAPEPEFQVLGASGRRHAAVPALDFDVHVSEPGGRAVYAIALSAQIMIEPARRAYDAETRERLVELFGAPERWATTTRSLRLAPGRRARAGVHRVHDLPGGGAGQLRHGGGLDQVPLRAARRRGAARLQLQRDGALPRRRRAAADVADPLVVLGRVPLPGGHLARADPALLPADRLGPAAGGHAAGAPAREGPRALPTLDACVAELLGEEDS